MEDRQFDALTRSLAAAATRRQMIGRLLAIGGAAIAGGRIVDADAVRRPSPTPRSVSCPGIQTWNGATCVCPTGEQCGPDCCQAGSSCCDGACCDGTCYGEERCCPNGSVVCDGECISGACCVDSDCGEGGHCTADRQCQVGCPDYQSYCAARGQCVSNYCNARMQYNVETCECECEPQYVPLVNTGACATPCESDDDCGGIDGSCRRSVEGQRLCGMCGESAYPGCTDFYPCTSSAFCQTCASAVNTYCADGVCYTSC